MNLVSQTPLQAATRPPSRRTCLVAADFYSFPSGHGTFAGVTLVLISFVIYRVYRDHSRTRIALGVALVILLALSVALSRVWLGVHYASDVAAGFALGLFWSGTCHAIRFGPPPRRGVEIS